MVPDSFWQQHGEPEAHGAGTDSSFEWAPHLLLVKLDAERRQALMEHGRPSARQPL